MSCQDMRLPNQTFEERKKEIRETIAELARQLAAGKVKPVIDKKTGAIAWAGWTDGQRNRVTDGCAYRLLMAQGNTTAKLAVARAEALAGRAVNREAIHHGHHSHDGGHTWHHGH